jgi:hypothetical protein
MARVIIDVSAAGKEWLKEILPDLSKCPNVKFVYSDHEKYRDEAASNMFLGNFLKLMKQKQMRDDTDPSICERLIRELNSLKEWQDEQACDDPHIFAMAYQRPDAFVFTSDARMVKCRGCMAGCLDKKFRSFSTIQSRSNYDANEHRIKA